jgi:hypothetical protein
MKERAAKILLVNFAAEDAKRLGEIALPADVGRIGRAVATSSGYNLPVMLPHPPYDYDLYVYDSNRERDFKLNPLPDDHNFGTNPRVLDGLNRYDQAPIIRISFLGPSAGLKGNLLGGAPSVETQSAHGNVSEFRRAREWAFSIPVLHDFIARLAPRIKSVHQYPVSNSSDYPLYHSPVLLNRNGDVVAMYCTTHTDKTHLSCVMLPQFDDNTAVLIDLLRVIAEVEPQVIPNLSDNSWLSSDKFLFSEEIAIEKEIESKQKELNGFIQDKRKEATEIVKKYEFIRKMLTNTEDGDKEERLSTIVKKTLEFLGFKVTDIDEKLKAALKKEDFWVEDTGFFAITEVSATVNKNPKTKEYGDLLARRSTIFQRRALMPEVDPSIVSGLLVLNFDIKTNPDKRPIIYGGGEQEFVGAAEENSIGLLSTVDLYRIAVDVKDGRLSREEARKVIRQFGRIVYPAERQKPATPNK